MVRPASVVVSTGASRAMSSHPLSSESIIKPLAS
jgi:hypothetical protein